MGPIGPISANRQSDRGNPALSSNLIERLQQTDRLPSAPGVALEIVRLSQAEEVELKDIVELLKLDPALVTKLVRTANSVMFGVPRRITSVRDAVVVMGVRTVNLLALSFSLVKLAKETSELGFDYTRYWTYSIATNVGARFLAQNRAPRLRDEAFLGGLLCRLGQLVLVEWAPEEYGPVLAELKETDRPLADIEKEVLGITNAEVTSALLDHWGLPRLICEALGAQNDPSRVENETARTLAQILHIATTCAELYTGGDVERHVEALRIHAESYFEMGLEDCNGLLGEIERQVPEAAQLYELDAGDPKQLAELRAKAEDLLLNGPGKEEQ